MPHALRVAFLVCLLLPVSASAVTFSFSGSIDSVVDLDNFLDDVSVAPNELVSGTYEVDLTTLDGASPFTVGPAQISFNVGKYEFEQSQDPHSIRLINNTGPPGSEVDLWQSGTFVVSDLVDPTTDPDEGTDHSGNFEGYAVRLEFFDNTHLQFDGTESAPFVPDSVAGWTQVRLVLDALQLNGGNSIGPNPRLQVQLNIDNFQVVPEPRSAALLSLGLLSLALHARRRARVR